MKRLLLIFSYFISAQLMAQSFDLVILNGKIIDGTGNSWYYGDVGIRSGKIVSIGKLSNAQAKRVIETKGLVVAPGFSLKLKRSGIGGMHCCLACGSLL